MKAFLRPFSGDISSCPPCWFMRQAGRYLPEYRALREEAGGFLAMCYTPDLATEITLQPIRRFAMDAAIIFSDILVIPQGLGQHLEFISGFGPKLAPVTSMQDCEGFSIESMLEFLTPVYSALRQTKAALPQETALIGFAGAPWTLLCYMLDGHGKDQFVAARSAIYYNPQLVAHLINLLTEAVAQHLCAQIEAGAEAVQLFDSWAAHVPYTHREQLIFAPARKILDAVHSRYPETPIICFPRGIGEPALIQFAENVKPDGLSIDQHTDIAYLNAYIDEKIVLQGNLDPLQLIYDSAGINRSAVKLINIMQQTKRPFIVNLGHGVLPSTPPEHMASLIQTIRSEQL